MRVGVIPRRTRTRPRRDKELDPDPGAACVRVGRRRAPIVHPLAPRIWFAPTVRPQTEDHGGTFGRCCCVLAFRTPDEAVEKANGVVVRQRLDGEGLAPTAALARRRRLGKRVSSDPASPFGGIRLRSRRQPPRARPYLVAVHKTLQALHRRRISPVRRRERGTSPAPQRKSTARCGQGRCTPSEMGHWYQPPARCCTASPRSDRLARGRV